MIGYEEANRTLSKAKPQKQDEVRKLYQDKCLQDILKVLVRSK